MTSTMTPPSMNAPPARRPPDPSSRRERGAGHIVAIVVGVLALLPAFGLLAGGATLAVGAAVVADDDGYFRYTLERVESDGVAIATTDLWLDDADGDAPWVFDWLDVDLRLRVEGAGPTDDVFVGVARTADLEEYLDGAAWSEVVEIDDRTAVTEDVAGRTRVTPPVDADIWTASTSGTGFEELTWRARGGSWSIVVMNADGTSDIAADVELGARSGAITPIAVTMLVVGGVLLAGAVALIVVGARGRRVSEPPAPGPGPGAGPDAGHGAPLPPPSAPVAEGSSSMLMGH